MSLSFEEHAARDARLVILRGLHEQTDGRLNEALLTKLLETFGHNRSREWVRTQVQKLKELGAVVVVEAGTVLIASITRAGIDHVERRSIIDGIARPSPEL
ncbi:VpaChn25_0724 family phage protein [Mycoplana ramosa]|uniref:Phage related protein n=1 Tax=Mycoplana ramosa TaxID=40837 RepID=A0ABW3Z234_MYCRA